MEAGKELDQMIAKAVFGIDLRPVEHAAHDFNIDYHTYPDYPCRHCDLSEKEGQGKPCVETFEPDSYSTSISAAWKVVEKITTPGDPVAYKQVQDLPAATRFYWLFDHANLWAMNSQEAATTICNLALRALGLISVDED